MNHAPTFMVVVALFAFFGCDKPGKVDIGELVEALQSLDADVASDTDELGADEDELMADLADVAVEGDQPFSDADLPDWDADLPDKDIVGPDEDGVEIEPDEDLSDVEVESEAEIEDDWVPDEDADTQSNVICTGQTKCYDNTDEITCPTEGNDFYGQDAQYAAMGYCMPRDYTVTGSEPEAIVLDNNTGLEWQKTLPATYAGCTGGTPTGSTCTWQEAIDYCTNLDYGTYDRYGDWRLPTRKELATLPDYSRCEPAIDPVIFPGTQSNSYWSSSSCAYSTDSAWRVYFDGSVVYNNKTTTNHARCVRGGALTDGAFTEETVSGKVIVTDTKTGFQWTKEYASSVIWQNALAHCENLDYGGHTDWRLPNIEELETLIDDTAYDPASIFPGMPSENVHFWSSSSYASRTVDAWTVNFIKGHMGSSYKATTTIYARCIRNETLTRTTKQWGTTKTEYGRSVAVDSNGNIFVTGHTGGDLDGNTNAGSGYDIFLSKWNANGTKAWTKQWGIASDDNGKSVAIDGSGNIFVTGPTTGGLDGNTSAGGNDIFLTKWNADGTKAWTKQWGTANHEDCNSVVIDSAGNIFVTGYTSGDLDGNISAGSSDVFLTKWTPDGTKVWTKQWGSTGGEEGNGVAVDGSGNIFVTGETNGSFDGNTNAGVGADIFLTKWNANGTKAWTKMWGTVAGDTGTSVAVDTNGDVFVTGNTGEALDGNTLVGSNDIFLTKWNTNGEKKWTRQWGTTVGDFGESVTTDAYGNAFVTGYTGEALDGNVSGGADDIFLTKWSPDGTKVWTKQWGGTLAEIGYSVKVEANNKIYVAGGTWGALDGNTFLGGVDAFLSIFSLE